MVQTSVLVKVYQGLCRHRILRVGWVDQERPGKMSSFHKVLQVGVTVREGKSVTQSRTVYRLEEHPYLGVWGGRGRT